MDRGADSAFQFDVVVIGSGAAGACAAIAAHELGLSAVILEKGPLLGGTTALSGGGIWAPANHFMTGAGEPDSIEAALTYMRSVVDDAGPSTSGARMRAFLENINPAIDLLERRGVRFRPISHYADYYPDKPGASVVGRGIEPAAFDLRKLGDWFGLMPPRAFPRTLPLANASSAQLFLAKRTLRGFATFIRIMLRYFAGRLRGQQLTGLGASLAGQLLYAVKTLDIPLWTATTADRLLVEGDRVTGVAATRDGVPVIIEARHGVHIAAGGFAKNLSMRQKHVPALGAPWSSASDTDQGDGLVMAQGVGAELVLLDEAWWVPATILPDGRPFFLVSERSKPGTIIVDQSGQRFLNESESYEDVGRHLLERDRTVPAIPSWLVFDQDYRNRYPFGFMWPGRTPQSLIDAGYFKRADTIEELARQCAVDPGGLTATVASFNVMAHTGVDEQFGRGQNPYDRHYGDPRIGPNPNLAPIARPPFYAVALYPGDLGTKGGILTDEHGRVLRADCSPIRGLYAAGNSTASVMGRSYPGPGATLGPALAFSFAAMRHLAHEARSNARSGEA